MMTLQRSWLLKVFKYRRNQFLIKNEKNFWITFLILLNLCKLFQIYRSYRFRKSSFLFISFSVGIAAKSTLRFFFSFAKLVRMMGIFRFRMKLTLQMMQKNIGLRCVLTKPVELY